MHSHADTDAGRLLRWSLRGNAVFSALSAVTLLSLAGPLASFLGFLSAREVFILGVQLGVFAAWLFWQASRPQLSRWQAGLVIALDVLWVIGSAQILLAGPPEVTLGGKWAVGMVADVVGIFAILQFIGLRRLARLTRSVETAQS